MRALVNRGPGRFVLEERPDPRPGPGEVLLRPAFTAVCFSDKHRYDGVSYGSPWRKGLVLGHEFSAIVAEPGEGAAQFSPGDRVSVDPRTYCGECLNCRAGLVTLCERGMKMLGVGNGPGGGYADLVVAPAYGLYKLPESVSLEAAAMAEPLGCATRTLRSSPFSIDDNVVVLGGEDYGLFLVQWLRQAGARNVVVADPLPHRRAAAEKLGATRAIDPTGSPGLDEARELMPHGADQVYVAMEDYVAAAQQYLRQAFAIARPQATVTILRTYGSAPYAAIDGLVPHMKELTIKHFGSFFSNEPVRGGRDRGDWQVAIDALAASQVDTRLPGRSVVDFADLEAPGAVDELFRGLPDSCTKAIIRIAGEA